VLGLGGLAIKKSYDDGLVSGKAQIQTQWDQDKAKIQATADAAVAQATKDKEAAIASNEGIANDLQTQLDSLRNLNASLAQRLRIAASITAGSGNMSQGPNNPSPASDATRTRLGQINDAIAASLTECRTNWANYSALIKELKPQL
jgi:hypothetical protein